MASLGHRPPSAWLSAWEVAARGKLPRFNAQELCNAAWALATLHVHVEGPFIRDFFRHSFTKLGYFNAQVVGWLMGGLLVCNWL